MLRDTHMKAVLGVRWIPKEDAGHYVCCMLKDNWTLDKVKREAHKELKRLKSLEKEGKKGSGVESDDE